MQGGLVFTEVDIAKQITGERISVSNHDSTIPQPLVG